MRWKRPTDDRSPELFGTLAAVVPKEPARQRRRTRGRLYRLVLVRSIRCTMLLLILALQDAAPMPEPDPTGLEWMTVASVLVPMVLLAVLIYLGRRNTV